MPGEAIGVVQPTVQGNHGHAILGTKNVRSRVGGELVKIAFEEGQMVKAGDLLAEIDPRSYQNALLQAQGTLMQNQAQLKNAQVDVQRYRDLYAQDSIAKQTLDTAEALVLQYQGTVTHGEHYTRCISCCTP